MKLKIYAIKDVVVGDMGNPFYLNNDEEAIRAFKNAINSNGTQSVCVNYKDMQLFKLGEFNTTTGDITSEVDMLIAGAGLKEGV